jgi:radical SAM protein (TIGR01212 family)
MITFAKNPVMQFSWGNTRPFHSLADQYKQQFGSRIQKVSVNAGFTCPNRDGRVGTGGCTFCNNAGFSPSYCHDDHTISEQITKGISFLKHRYKRTNIFIAYMQAYSNTYAPLDVLKNRYEEALSHKDISGLSIGTRPDCIDDDILDYLEELSKSHYISIEYGVESCYEETLLRINRGHTFTDSVKAIEKTASRGLQTAIHLIIGLPGETRKMMLNQSRIISSLPIHSVKFHQLQIVKDTPMALEFQEHPERFRFFEPDDYVEFMVEFIENLRPDIAIERFAGEVPPQYNLRPSWKGLRSDQVTLLVEQKLREKNSWQGKNYPT